MSKFLEITVSTTHEGSELVADILGEYTELGVSIKDIEDVIALEKDGKYWDYADNSIYTADKKVFVTASYEIENGKAIIEEIIDRLNLLKSFSPFDFGSLETIVSEIDGDAWREEWKKRFKPIHIGSIVIVPNWIEYEPKENEKVVLLDSNMAFGTGEHQTTSMCVSYLEKYVEESKTVIDVGCGSGILGITASKLGANEVIMTDIDECAIVASNKNVELNNVKGATVMLKNLLDDNTVKGDIIVCNIMAEVLIAFAPDLKNNLTENGVVILSGILKDRLDKVEKVYTEQGYKFIEDKTDGEWSACVFRKGE